FLSSHILSEVERICDHVGIIREGELISISSLDQTRALRLLRVEVEFEGEVPKAALQAAAGVSELEIEGKHARCVVNGSIEALLHALQTARVVSLISHEPSLEEIFLTYYDSKPAPATRPE